MAILLATKLVSFANVNELLVDRTLLNKTSFSSILGDCKNLFYPIPLSA
jgi:hypothetical protein